MKPRQEPAFEIVCLGAGGGPLEGDVLGYMCKPYARRWDEGWLGLEGGGSHKSSGDSSLTGSASDRLWNWCIDSVAAPGYPH